MKSESTRGQLDGMTVNERLVAAGLYAEWQKCASEKNRAAMEALLVRVGIPSDQARFSINAVLADPSRFGFK